MAEKAEKKPAPAEGAHGDDKAKAPAKGKGGIFTKLPVLLGGVMVIEAAVLFAGFKLLGAKSQPAAGATLTTGEAAEGQGAEGATAKKAQTVEISVTDLKALNRASGHTYLFDLSIYVVIKSEKEQTVTDIFKADKALIDDRIRTIIAESDPEKLGGASEPGLETLRRQIKFQLDRIVGEGNIEEVLVPRCIPFRTDY
jgi:flagellar basal body-associated protein FliL